MTMDELQLVKRASKGDSEAFRELAEKYQNKVYYLCLRYTKNREDALDCAQTALIKAYYNLSKFGGRSSFATWIYSVTRNVCLDFLRKTKSVLPLEVLDECNLLDSVFCDPSISAENAELHSLLKKLIYELPQDMRRIFILREFDGYSYAEIAELMGIAQGTVKSRLSRARERLRISLKHEEPEGEFNEK